MVIQLWNSNVTMENLHVPWTNPLYMAIFTSKLLAISSHSRWAPSMGWWRSRQIASVSGVCQKWHSEKKWLSNHKKMQNTQTLMSLYVIGFIITILRFRDTSPLISKHHPIACVLYPQNKRTRHRHHNFGLAHQPIAWSSYWFLL